MKKLLAVVMAALFCSLFLTSSISSDAEPAPPLASVDFDRPLDPWVADNPYLFQIGDSVTRDCYEDFGMDWRSLGYVGWPGSTTGTMIDRLSQTTEGWDWTTESSNAEERQWFQTAGALVIGLGTIDVKVMTAEQFRANIEWFMAQANGRPVLWFNIHNPPFQAQVDAFNYELWAASFRHQNLKVMDWEKWASTRPTAFVDQVHVATYAEGCVDGRNKLIQMAAPGYTPDGEAPSGYWYPSSATTGPVSINGWAAGTVDKVETVSVNIRSDYGHVVRFPASGGTDDLWAQTASGRGFAWTLTENFRGHLICVDVIDGKERWTSLGCRRP